MNQTQTILLIGGMLLLLALLGYGLAGGTGIAWAVGIGLFLLLFGQQASPRLVLRMNRARPISYAEAPELHELTAGLVRRANLPTLPKLYYVPNRMMNAFAVGSQRKAVIGVTDGLLRGLSQRELTAVLAHEIGHIQNNDLRTAAFAGLVNRLTRLFSGLGQLFLFINLPLLLMGQIAVSWWVVFLLLAAPSLSSLLQLAVSRTREFDADLAAVELTRDAVGLATALRKIERSSLTPMQRLFGADARSAVPAIFRTHPHTEERIARLVSVSGQLQPAQPQPIFF